MVNNVNSTRLRWGSRRSAAHLGCLDTLLGNALHLFVDGHIRRFWLVCLAPLCCDAQVDRNVLA